MLERIYFFKLCKIVSALLEEMFQVFPLSKIILSFESSADFKNHLHSKQFNHGTNNVSRITKMGRIEVVPFV